MSGLLPDYLFEKRYLRAAVMTLVLFAVGLAGYFLFSAGYGDGLEATMDRAGADSSSYFNAPLSYGDDYPHALLSGIIGFFIVLLSVNYYGKFMEGRSGQKIIRSRPRNKE